MDINYMKFGDTTVRKTIISDTSYSSDFNPEKSLDNHLLAHESAAAEFVCQVGYNDSSRTTVLEYRVTARPLLQGDRSVQYAGANYSVTGIEMSLQRHLLKANTPVLARNRLTAEPQHSRPVPDDKPSTRMPDVIRH